MMTRGAGLQPCDRRSAPRLAGAALLVAGLAVSLVPAAQASRVDPVAALRME